MALSVALLPACGPKQPLKIAYEDIIQKEQKMIDAYQAQVNSMPEPSVQFIQPKNIETPCLVRMEDFPIPLDVDAYWEGQCKNGYAYGLGRAFVEQNGILLSETISSIKENGEGFDIYYQKEYQHNAIFEGKNRYGVVIWEASNPSYSVKIQAGLLQPKVKEGEIKAYTLFEPINDFTFSTLQYDAVGYLFLKNNNPYDEVDIKLGQCGRNCFNGFVIERAKTGNVVHAEVKDNSFIQYVQLPSEFIEKLNSIEQKIRTETNKGLEAQREALNIIDQYSSKICEEPKRIPYISDKYYFAICKRNEVAADLQQRIADERARVNAEKEKAFTARTQRQQAEAQAWAAQVQAQAAQNQANALQNQANAINNQTIQFNNQLQQLNNQLILQQFK